MYNGLNEHEIKRLIEEIRTGRLLCSRAIAIAYEAPIHGTSWEYVF